MVTDTKAGLPYENFDANMSLNAALIPFKDIALPLVLLFKLFICLLLADDIFTNIFPTSFMKFKNNFLIRIQLFTSSVNNFSGKDLESFSAFKIICYFIVSYSEKNIFDT